MKELKGYYRSIKRVLPVGGKLKCQLLEQTRQSVTEYLVENPDVQYDDVVKHFGTPEEIADAYIAEMATPEMLSKFKIQKIVLIILCIIAATALFIWGTAIVAALINELSRGEGYIYIVGPS